MARRKVTRGSPPRLARSTRPRTRPATATVVSRPAAPAARVERPAKAEPEGAEPARSDEAPNFLGLYFREMSGLGVMSPEEELRVATAIATLRR